MHPAARLKLGAKGAVLWILAALFVGVLAAAVFQNEASQGLPWIAAAVGMLGGVAHFLVAITKAHPEDIKSTGGAVALLATVFTVMAAYWITGSKVTAEPAALLTEALRVGGYVFVPVGAMSYLVLRLVIARSAA